MYVCMYLKKKKKKKNNNNNNNNNVIFYLGLGYLTLDCLLFVEYGFSASLN